jgi:hypothetical protein
LRIVFISRHGLRERADERRHVRAVLRLQTGVVL